MKIMSLFLSDAYKQWHFMMYPKGMYKLYSNMTPRSYKYLGCEESVFFGLQYYIKKYLIEEWNENFFNRPLEEVLAEYKRFHKFFSMVDISVTHIEKLHKLGYLPLRIKGLKEGTRVPVKVPYYTIVNTDNDSAWLVNFLETQMSTVIWDMCVVATIGDMYRKVLNKYALETTGTTEGVQWQGHDFCMRGRSSIESTFNQAGWLLSFTGTDTIPAVLMLEEYYDANIENELVGSSVPASEHSVMTSYGKEDELGAFKRLLDQFPTGILSIVSDSFDLWKVCTEFLPKLKEQILARDGKLVIRPDSGDPVDIICGEVRECVSEIQNSDTKDLYRSKDRGVIELLWDVFGGTVNEQGYKVLDPHIGAIYGDSITLERAEQICQRLKAKGFASTNIVLGVGSYTMNYNTRDSLGIAVKSTYCEVYEECEGDCQAHQDEKDVDICNDGCIKSRISRREIFKDPITDDGLKKSAKGLLSVIKSDKGLILKDQCSWEEEAKGELQTVFLNGKLIKSQSLKEIRKNLNK